MPLYSMYKSSSYNSRVPHQIWITNSSSTPIQNKGYNHGLDIFKAVEAMTTKEKEATTRAIANEKEAVVKVVKN